VRPRDFERQRFGQKNMTNAVQGKVEIADSMG